MHEYQERVRLAKIVLGGSSDAPAREAACADLRAVAKEAEGTAAAREALEALELCHTNPFPSYSDPEMRKLRQDWSGLMGLTDSRLPGLLETLKENPALATCIYQEALGRLRKWLRVALDGENEMLEPRNVPALQKVVELISGIDVLNVALVELHQLRDALFHLRYQETARRIEEAIGRWDIGEAWRLWDALGTPPKGLEDDVERFQREIYEVAEVRRKVEALLARTPSVPPTSWADVGELVRHTQELFTYRHEYRLPESRREELNAELERELAVIAHFAEAEAARALSFAGMRDFWKEFERLPRTEVHRTVKPQAAWFNTFLKDLEEKAGRKSAGAANLEELEKYSTYLKGERAGLPDFIVAQVDSLLGRISQVIVAWRAMSSGEEFTEPAELPLPPPANMVSEAPFHRAQLDALHEAFSKLSSGVPASEALYSDAVRVAEGVLEKLPGYALAVELKREAEQRLTAYRVERAVANWDIAELLRLSGANPGVRAYDYYTENEEVLKTWFTDVDKRPPLDDFDKAALWWMNWIYAVSQLTPGAPGALTQAIARQQEKRRGEWYALLSGLLGQELSHDKCKEIAKSLEDQSADATLAALRQNFLRKADVAKAYEYLNMKRWDDAQAIINNLHKAHPDTRRLNTHYMVERAKSKGVEPLSLVLKSEWRSIRSHFDKALELLLEAVEEAWEQNLTKTLGQLRQVVARALGHEAAEQPAATVARLKEWEEWFDIEQAVLDGESAASLKSLLAYMRENRDAELLRQRLDRLVMQWDADANLVMLAWAASVFDSISLDYDALDRLTAESNEAGKRMSETLRTKAELTHAQLDEMLRDISRQEADWKKLNDYLNLTGDRRPRPRPPERFRTAVEQARGLRRIMFDLRALARADLRDPALQDRLETVVSGLRELRHVAAREWLLKQAARLEPLTKLDEFRKHIREAARQCGSEAHIFESEVFSALSQRVRALVKEFEINDALGGHMWDAVSKDCCEEVYRLACIYEAHPDPPHLETLAARLDELNRVDRAFIRAITELWETRPFVNADTPFTWEQHADYLARLPDTVPPFRRAYLYFEHRLVGVAAIRSVIEKSRHKLPRWVDRYLDDGIPPCAAES